MKTTKNRKNQKNLHKAQDAVSNVTLCINFFAVLNLLRCSVPSVLTFVLRGFSKVSPGAWHIALKKKPFIYKDLYIYI